MTVPLNSMFTVTYGNKLDLNKMVAGRKSKGGVNFVGRSSQHHGVSAIIEPIPGVLPFPAGSITVALGGTKLLTSFVQFEPFYTAQNVAVLVGRREFTMTEKLYICLCIQHNRFRYSAFGREANRTLRTLPIPSPEEFPAWLREASITSLEANHSSPVRSLERSPIDLPRWRPFRLSELFVIRKGIRLTQANASPGSTPFVSAIESNNGIRQRIFAKPTHRAGLITVTYNGSVAEAFYQPEPFFASDDVNVLYPRFEMDAYSALFLCAVIRREKYRYNYGRKWNLERMNDSEILLPATPDGMPDWEIMQNIIKELPYSGAIVDGAKGVVCSSV